MMKGNSSHYKEYRALIILLQASFGKCPPRRRWPLDVPLVPTAAVPSPASSGQLHRGGTEGITPNLSNAASGENGVPTSWRRERGAMCCFGTASGLLDLQPIYSALLGGARLPRGSCTASGLFRAYLTNLTSAEGGMI